MMRKNHGNTITSYALLLGLIVILAIPAVMLLGNTTSDTIDQVSGESRSGMDNLVGLLTKEANSSQNGSSTVQVSPILFFDEESGVTTIVVGDGANTTSASGKTEAISMALEDYVQSLTNDNTQALPEDLRRLLNNLAEAGVTLSEEEATEEVNLEDPNCADKVGCPLNENYFDRSLLEAFQDFSADYRTLSGHPAYTDEIRTVVDQLAGSITNIADTHYISHMNPDEDHRGGKALKLLNDTNEMVPYTGDTSVNVDNITFAESAPVTETISNTIGNVGS